MKIQFRPHHFLCALGFRGKGYSPEFVQGFWKIMEELGAEDSGDNTPIEVVGETDSICIPCPHRREKRCESENRIQKLDERHAKALGLKSGDNLTWGEAKERIKSLINESTFDEICDGCNWKEMGVCLDSLNQLRGSS